MDVCDKAPTTRDSLQIGQRATAKVRSGGEQHRTKVQNSPSEEMSEAAVSETNTNTIVTNHSDSKIDREPLWSEPTPVHNTECLSVFLLQAKVMEKQSQFCSVGGATDKSITCFSHIPKQRQSHSFRDVHGLPVVGARTPRRLGCRSRREVVRRNHRVLGDFSQAKAESVPENVRKKCAGRVFGDGGRFATSLLERMTFLA